MRATAPSRSSSTAGSISGETNYAVARGEAIRLVMGALTQAGIGMPEPTYRLNVAGGGLPVIDLPDVRGPPGRDGGDRRRPPRRSIPASRHEDVGPDGTIERMVRDERRADGDEDLSERSGSAPGMTAGAGRTDPAIGRLPFTPWDDPALSRMPGLKPVVGHWIVGGRRLRGADGGKAPVSGDTARRSSGPAGGRRAAVRRNCWSCVLATCRPDFERTGESGRPVPTGADVAAGRRDPLDVLARLLQEDLLILQEGRRSMC